MRKKLLSGIVLIILIITAGTIYLFANDSTEPQATISPYIEFEATVMSSSIDNMALDELALDESKPYKEGEELYKAPDDSAVIRIDKIIETGGSYDFDWASLEIEEKTEVSLDFKYTIRPTKIITIIGETTQSGDVTSHTILPAGITFENNYFIFRENGNSETETILQGLQEGSKFKTRLWKTSKVEIEKYEIIS